MPNVFAEPIQPDSSGGNAFGNQQPRSGGNLFKLREIWMEQYTDGKTSKQFTDWLAEQNHKLYAR